MSRSTQNDEMNASSMRLGAPPKAMAERETTPIEASVDSRELIRLCRAGRLYDVEKWIAAG
jgi:hypothetical protein